MSDGKPLESAATEESRSGVPPEPVSEVVGGTRVLSPRLGPLQVRAVGRLLKLLTPVGQGEEGAAWVLLEGTALHLAEDVLVPELVGWRRERLAQRANGPVGTLVPDWVCEVLSEETEALDRGHKMLAYGRERVEHVWLVNPESRTLEVYRFEGDGWALLAVHEGGALVRAEPFEALEWDLGLLWSR